eukprot:TRINITY_DN59624_c0_g1_i1.p1 TRINITY_DN59624_c0_g1~~TRINITY_DN59624_c0_g1_i1.p1  ORF type:complete len:499 (+),score=205.80 TRINITY_DN59624_c0_g1_i1:74-1570(+)
MFRLPTQRSIRFAVAVLLLVFDWSSSQDSEVKRLMSQYPGQAPAQWAKAAEADKCSSCNKPFSLLVRKHSCRRCQAVVCDSCSTCRVRLDGMDSQAPAARVCDGCYQLVVARGQRDLAASSGGHSSGASGGTKSNNSSNNSSSSNNSNNSGNGGPPALRFLADAFPKVPRHVLQQVLIANGNDPTRASEQLIALPDRMKQSSGAAAAEAKQEEFGELSDAEKQLFFQNGFIHLPNVVPKHLLHDALREINASLGRGINSATHHMDSMWGQQKQTFCPDVKNSPHVTNLYTRSAVSTYVQSLLGRNRVHVPRGGQIAIVHPKSAKEATEGRAHVHRWFNADTIGKKKYWHIDGVTTDFARMDRVHNFTLLVGVYLSEQDAEFQGNFTTFPGAHHLLQDWIQTQGLEAAVKHLTQVGVPVLPLPDPFQIQAKPGDVVLAHYQLPHTVAPHFGPNVRYAIYFRVFSKQRSYPWAEAPHALSDMWIEYEGMYDVVKQTHHKQ